MLFASILFALGLFMNNASAAETKAEDKKTAVATFAGGCFWCMTPPYDNLKSKGVLKVVAGYTGGRDKTPTYEEVSSGSTGHIEAVQVTYDPSKISYDALLDAFWRNIDPTDEYGQFADKGTQYITAIFYHGDEQRRLAEASKEKLDKSGKFNKPVKTKILPAAEFYPAESYHQDYYLKNPTHYNAYKKGSGREGFLKKTWGDH